MSGLLDRPRGNAHGVRSSRRLAYSRGRAQTRIREPGSDAMPTTGEKPGVGTYKCRKCGTTVRLDDPDDTLPPCPKCNGTEFDKIG